MKKILVLTAGFLLMGSTLYAGNGDLIVNGKLGVGTSPSAKLQVAASSQGVNSLLVGAYSSGIDISGYQPGLKLTPSSGVNWSISNNEGSFLVYDGTNNRSVVSIIGGAPANSLYINSSGKVGIGTPNPLGYLLYVNGPAFTPAGVWTPSDIKYKKDIKQIDSALDKVNNLTGVSYLYKTDEYKDKNFPEGTQLGVIAQELEKVIPEAVMEDEEGSKAVNYSEIIPVLIEAIKAQQKEIDDLQSTVTQLQSKSK